MPDIGRNHEAYDRLNVVDECDDWTSLKSMESQPQTIGLGSHHTETKSSGLSWIEEQQRKLAGPPEGALGRVAELFSTNQPETWGGVRKAYAVSIGIGVAAYAFMWVLEEILDDTVMLLF